MNAADTLSRLSPEDAADLRRARRAAGIVGLWYPLGLTVVATVLLLTWLPRLPDPMASHWGSGGIDGFTPQWGYVALVAGFGAGMSLILGGIVVRVTPSSGFSPSAQPIWSPIQRFLSAFSAMLVTFILIVLVGGAALQRGLTDARETDGIGTVMLVASAVGLLTGAIGWFVQPRVRIDAAPGDAPEPMPLTPTERAVWVGTARPSRGLAWTLGGAVALVGCSTVPAALGGGSVGWIIGAAAVLVIVVVASSLWFRVRIDDGGLTARSLIGWPVFRVPARDVERVVATQINPFAEFGGWGLRWTPGRIGIVLRAGEGIIITRRDGSIFGVTVDDAETGAALLATAALRSEPDADRP